MPKNRHALIRYKTIDACLRRTSRQWTLLDLQEACQQALSELKGDPGTVSTRQVSRDIAHMRADYGAPIEVEGRKYYYYSDPSFSIEKGNLNEDDLILLQELKGILAPFNEFHQLERLDDLIRKISSSLNLPDKPNTELIQFERAKQVPGRHHLPRLLRSISESMTVSVRYQSFKHEEAHTWQISPWLLKEYNSRWYVLGWHHDSLQTSILALDRILSIRSSDLAFHASTGVDLSKYFANRIGVSGGLSQAPQEITLWVSAAQAPYIASRPLHETQVITENSSSGIVITLKVLLNYELESRILSFGEGIRVIGPVGLKEKIEKRIEKMRTE